MLPLLFFFTMPDLGMIWKKGKMLNATLAVLFVCFNRLKIEKIAVDCDSPYPDSGELNERCLSSQTPALKQRWVFTDSPHPYYQCNQSCRLCNLVFSSYHNHVNSKITLLIGQKAQQQKLTNAYEFHAFQHGNKLFS